MNIVATPENIPALEHIRSSFKGSEIEHHVDPYTDPGFNYTPERRKMLSAYIQAERDVNAERRFEDFAPKRCSAGRNYINITPDGARLPARNDELRLFHAVLAHRRWPGPQ